MILVILALAGIIGIPLAIFLTPQESIEDLEMRGREDGSV